MQRRCETCSAVLRKALYTNPAYLTDEAFSIVHVFTLTSQVTLEGAIAELRDSIHHHSTDPAPRILDEHKKVNEEMSDIQKSLFHVVAALKEQDDEDAATLSIQTAIDKLHSVLKEDDDELDKRHRQLVSPNNAIIGTSMEFLESTSGIRGTQSETSKETTQAHVAIVKKAFKTAVGKLHHTLQDEQNTKYLNERILQVSQGQAENNPAADITNALKSVIDVLLNDGNEKTTRAVLDVMGTLLAMPVSFLTETVAFGIDYASHQMTCLKSKESTSRMQMILFVDYLMRLRFDVDSFRLRDGLP